MFLTIIAGVTIFVLGQFVIKLMLEAIVEFKEVLGEVSALFLREQSGFINNNVSQDVQNEIKRLSSMVLAKKQAILLYSIFSRILRMPSEVYVLKGCHSLNLISYLVMKDPSSSGVKRAHTWEVYKEMKLISKYLKIQIMYSDHS